MTDEITWKLTRANDTLRVEWRFENRTANVMYACDGLIVALQGGGYMKANNYVLEEQGDTALLRIGQPSSDVPSAVVPPCFFVQVPAGQAVTGSREIKLPLRRWDAMGREHKLSDKIVKLAFALEVFEGEPRSWNEVQTKDGKPLRYPEGFTPRLVRGGTQAIPKK